MRPILPDRTLLGRARTRLRHQLGRPTVDWYDVGDRLQMGRHSYNRPKVRWYYGDSAAVRIGHFCSLADEVVILIGGVHPLQRVSTFPFRAHFHLPGAYVDGVPASDGDVIIGSDVYVGRGAQILSGVNIGHGAVIGAYSVVAKDVRPYAVVVGNPAREVRRRFNDAQVEALLRIGWWDWPEDKILGAIPQLCSESIEEFVRRHDRASIDLGG